MLVTGLVKLLLWFMIAIFRVFYGTLCEYVCTLTAHILKRSPSTPWYPSEITPSFLTSLLKKSGDLTVGDEIASISRETIGDGFASYTCRIHLTYHTDSQRPRPNSVVVKSTRPGVMGRFICFAGSFWGEPEFYLKIASNNDIPIPIPRILFAKHWNQTDLIMIFQDLGRCTAPDTPLWNTAQDVLWDDLSLCIRQLAEVQAHWWQRPELEKMEWLEKTKGREQRLSLWVSRLSIKFYTKYKSLLPSNWTLETLQEYAKVIPAVLHYIRKRFPPTLCHGDYRMGNMCWSKTESGSSRAVVLDWQMCNSGAGIMDFSYLLAFDLPSSVRKEREYELLKEYSTYLSERGVQMDWEQMKSFYVLSFIVHTLNLIIGISLVSKSEKACLLDSWIRRITLGAEENQALAHAHKMCGNVRENGRLEKA